MINRVLIRIKVIQMLYSYLITEKHFSLEPQPSQPTKEKRFAYKLYIDTLALFVELSRNMGKNNKMLANRFTSALATTDIVKAIIVKQTHGEKFEFAEIIPDLVQEIKNSGIYKLYVKKSADDTLASDVKVWKDLYEHIIRSNSHYNRIAEKYENYSLRGIDRTRELMDATFSNFMTSHGGINEALTQLNNSMEASREVYMRLLMLPVAIVDLRMQRIQEGQAKHLPTPEDINPDMRLVESPLIDLIRENVQINKYAEEHNIDWLRETPELINDLLKSVMASEAYAEYKLTPPSLESDYAFWRNVLIKIVNENETFLEEMENKSVFWNDDIAIMSEFAIKTLHRFEEGMGQNSVLDKFKDEDDERFGRQLFIDVINNKEKYRGIIEDCLDSKIWESERLAYMDVVIILTAMAEMLNFPSIPLKVTFNEYIELAKSYSTSKSGMFVNGLLGVIVARLRREGLLLKSDTPLK